MPIVKINLVMVWIDSHILFWLASQNIEISRNKASNSLSIIYNHSQWALKAMLAFFCSEENLGINCTCIFLDLRI